MKKKLVIIAIIVVLIVAGIIVAINIKQKKSSVADNGIKQSDNNSISKSDKLTESKPEEFFSTTRSDGNMEILLYEGKANIINVPDTIKGKPVIEINGYLVRDRDNVVEVNIPDTITEISEEAFGNCTNLENLTMGKNVQKIGESLCLGDKKLKQLVLSDALTEIPVCAFGLCTSLEVVTIPDSVTLIKENAFGGCTSLKEVHITNSATKLTDIGLNSSFDGCDNLTIYAPKGSYAEQYAKNNNIPFVEE